MTYNFVNPYNFMPLSEDKDIQKSGDKKLSGAIEYEILTKTPLFIPNTSNDHVFYAEDEKTDHKSYDFFSYNDLSNQKASTDAPAPETPVIPGSEFRGLIRSNFEMLTHSCMSAIDDKMTLSKRTCETFKAGLIKKENNGSYSLYQAKDCLWRTKGENSTEDEKKWENDYYNRKCYKQDKFKEGELVNFFLATREGKCKPLVREVRKGAKLPNDEKRKDGYLIKGEDGPTMESKGDNHPIPQKHCAHIFVLVSESISKDIEIKDIEKVLEIYNNNNPGAYKEYKEQLHEFENGKGNEYFPVYYSKLSKECVYLSPAAKTRELYHTNLKELAGNLAPCTDKNSLCPACSLFGSLGEGWAVSSRLRFSDAVAEKNDDGFFMSPVTLKPLSSPKPSNTEFYLKRPEDAAFWTYEYYVDNAGDIKPYHAELAGRKFYWHYLAADESTYADKERTDQNITVRPAKKGIKFRGTVYFKNISEEELNQLVYTLEAGDDKPIQEKTHGYKLGTAKPLGMGSVAISVDKVTIRKYRKDSINRTITVEEDITSYTGMSAVKNAKVYDKDSFKQITAFEAISGCVVDYPHKNNPADNCTENEIFKWFVGNHQGYDWKNLRETKSPNTRNGIIFKEYLKPLNPQTIPNDSPNHKDISINKSEINSTSYGTIIGRNNTGNFYKIQMNNRSKASIGVKEVPEILSEGDKVELRYKGNYTGKDGRQYSRFEFIKKI
jgi:CRISPR-associated protein (TIGR03986 family)